MNNPTGAAISAGDVAERCVTRIEKGVDGSDSESRDRLPALIENLRDSIGLMTTASRRVADIVGSLKNFARLDEAERQLLRQAAESFSASVTRRGSSRRASA